MSKLSDKQISQILTKNKVRGTARLAARSALRGWDTSTSDSIVRRILRTQTGGMVSSQQTDQIISMAKRLSRVQEIKKIVRSKVRDQIREQRAAANAR